MRTKLSLLALLCLATPVLGQDRAEFSSIIINGPKIRKNSSQVARIERDFANQLLALAPRVRSNKVVLGEVAMSLTRLGRLEAAMKIAPEEKTRIVCLQLAARRSSVEGNEKSARALIAQLPLSQRMGSSLFFAQSLIINRGKKREALAILKTLPVIPLSFSSYDLAQLLAFKVNFEVALWMAVAGDRDAAIKRYDLLELRIKHAEKQVSKNQNEMVKELGKTLTGLLMLYRFDAGLENEALKMVGQDEFSKSKAVDYFLEKNQEEKVRQISNVLPPDVSAALFTRPSYAKQNMSARVRNAFIRERLFREVLPKTSAVFRDRYIRDLASVFLAVGEAEKSLAIIEEFSQLEERARAVHDFKRAAVIENRYSLETQDALHKKWGEEELVSAQMAVRKLKNQAYVTPSDLAAELNNALLLAISINDRKSAKNALYELEKIGNSTNFPLSRLIGLSSRELEFAYYWGEVGDWGRASRWMSRVSPPEKQAGLSNKLNLLLLSSNMFGSARSSQLLPKITPKEWSQLNIEQVGQISNAFGAEASNRASYRWPAWINNLPRAEQRTFALARWVANIWPYETMVYALPENA